MKNRKVHIDDNEWIWVIESGKFGEVKEARIYSPDKTMYRVKGEDISNITKYVGLEGDLTFNVTPKMVKDYIIKTILKK